ncbi:amino-acid N-acetyltransferase [Amnibacterium setariae]|uniref:Amino-acid N-acetyltransferase n=1 Tax=Amnibacterium setariae TaxID=2306585 RepID=A0A3A1UA80_9MICO|nr:amino-acid N-acetyltransferase [Amnibacterium setariae]RIX30246.1 amino-acid N-acetyltransferase [Amnibacterium setariae]
MPEPSFRVRRARVKDVPQIQALVAPLVEQRILLGKDAAVLYAAVQEFRIAEDAATGAVVGCGALHVMWDDLAEIRTVAVDAAWRRRHVGHALVERLEDDARDLGVNKLFCLTFEVDFFSAHGYAPVGEGIVGPDVVIELARSGDEGVAEFLDLARVKPNTLGNTRMLKVLPSAD